MAEEKGYLNTDELQADDELSPRPAREEKAADSPPKRHNDVAREAPRPATSE